MYYLGHDMHAGNCKYRGVKSAVQCGMVIIAAHNTNNPPSHVATMLTMPVTKTTTQAVRFRDDPGKARTPLHLDSSNLRGWQVGGMETSCHTHLPVMYKVNRQQYAA
jgi:hypothetical protein